MLTLQLQRQLAEKYRHQYRELQVGQDGDGNIIVEVTWISGRQQRVGSLELYLLQPQGSNEPDPE